MDFSNITAMYGNAYSAAANQSASKLQNKLTDADYSLATDDELMDACKQFEAYLWEQIYKEMEKASKALCDDEEGDAYAANMTDYFKDTVIQQISSQTADERSNSLAQLLYEQAKRNYDL